MKKCNNKDFIVKFYFLFKVGLWLTLLTTPHFIQGSHLPENYIRDASRRDSQESSSEQMETTQEIKTSVPTTADLTETDTSLTPTSSSSPLQPQQHKRIRQDDEVTVRSSLTPGHGISKMRPSADTSNAIGQPSKKYSSIQASCDDKGITISGQFPNKFKGRIYAYGYPDEPECGVTFATDPRPNVTFLLPLGQCGVQMMAIDPEIESDRRHEVTLYVQYSSFLQQIVDDKVAISCVEVKKNLMEDSLQLVETGELSSTRQGRRMGTVKDSAGSKPGGQTKISSKIGESWMEILAGKDPSPKSRKMLPVAVGEDVTLVISTKVMRGYDARIVNCSANDGSRIGVIDGYRSQQVLDSAGCSVDTSLVPNFRRRRLPIESRNRMITLHFATFQAFKFPERDHLHIKCNVAYCQGPCPQEPCDSGVNHFGTWREKYGRIADALIDTAEIVNSVEVTAPDLEESVGGGHYFERHQSSAPGPYTSGGSATDVSSRQFSDTLKSAGNNENGHSSSSSSGNNQVPIPQPNFANNGSVCVSPGSVILALVILGVVLVISATATLWFALKRSEAKKYQQAVKHTPFQHGPQPYYRFSHW